MSEAEIREIDRNWNEYIASGDVPAIAALYAGDAQFLMPGRPAVVGVEGIAAAWRGMLDMPGFGLALTAEEIVVDGDLAMDRGTYRLTATTPDGAFEDVGKYLVVWQRSGGTWLVRADMFNSDGAPG